MTRKKLLALGAAISAVAAIAVAQPSQAADSYLKGKQITFIVGFGAGGGYDAYSRLLAPHYERVTGADVTVVNQPGAGGLNALNRMYNLSKGQIQMMIVNGPGGTLQQLVDLKGVRFDLTKMPTLGIIDSPRWVWLAKNNSPISTPMDAIKRDTQISWGGSGKISGMSDGAAMLCYVLGLKCNVVTAYKGSRAAALAVAQGEMDAIYVSETSALQYVQAKNAKAIATVNRKRSVLFPDLPTVFETLKLNEEQQWWLDYRATLEGLGRILFVPPDTPPEALAELQAATHKILTDPKVLAEADKKKRFIKYIPADEAAKMVKHVLTSISDAKRAEVKKIILN